MALALPDGASRFEQFAALPRAEREAQLAARGRAGLTELGWRWASLARAAQLPPDGAWRTWLILAGRGFGKTRAGAEWVYARATENPEARIALVAASYHEGRAVMIDGESGLIAVAPDAAKPEWNGSKRVLTWPRGAQAFLYSAGEPEGLRGAQHHHAWCDEIGKWPRGVEAWDNLAMGLRLGSAPRTVATTTPRAVPLVRRLAAEASAGTGVAITRGRTADNRAYLAPAFLETMRQNYAGTLFGRQELDGELIGEVEGALWSRAAIEEARVAAAPAMARIVIGVDPPAGIGGDACGIVVAGLGEGPAAPGGADRDGLRPRRRRAAARGGGAGAAGRAGDRRVARNGGVRWRPWC